jgi:outer membrane protein TolC
MKKVCCVPLCLGLLAGCVHYQAQPLSPGWTAAELESRTLSDPGLRAFIEANSIAVSEWPRPSWDFSSLSLVAFYYHPSLEVARAQWGVAKSGIKTAGGRPNPILSVTPGYSSNPPKGVSPWFPSVSIDVPIETAGKRHKRIAHAEHLSEAARLNLVATAWQIRSNVRSAVLELTAAQRRAELLAQELEVQEQLVKLLEQRLAAGAVSLAEVMPTRIARLKTFSDVADARRQSAEVRVRLAEALGVPAAAVQSLQLDPKSLLPSEELERLLTTQARQQALQSRADILGALADYAAAESALQLEIARQYPDVHLSPGYQFDQGENKWSLGLSVELPLLNRNQGPIAEAEAKRAEAEARFLSLQAKVIAEIDRAAQAHAAVRDQVRNQETLLQSQHQQAETVRAAFRAGAADQFEIGSARLEETVAALALFNAQTKAEQALGQLEDALQIPFEALRSVETGHIQRSGKEQKP